MVKSKKNTRHDPPEPEMVRKMHNEKMAVEANEDEFPSIDRIPTAREFNSFDSSSDDDTAMAHRYEVDESKLTETDSYDFVGVVGVASEESSAAPLWGGSRKEDDDCDWVADSFDHYDQRQVGVAKLKTKVKMWQKSNYLADEEEDFIAESRVKQSVRKRNSPKIYSPPSMKDYSYDDDDEDSISMEGTRKKDISEKIAAIAKRVHEKDQAQDDESMSVDEDRNPSSNRPRSKDRSARRRSPSPPAEESPLRSKSLITESSSESSRSASPVRKDAVQPPSEVREPLVTSEPVESKDSSEDGDLSSRRSSKVGKLLSLPFKSRSSRKGEVVSEEQIVSPPVSQVSRGTSTVKETIDLPTGQEVFPNISMADAATNTSLPKSPSSVSSLSGRQKSSRKSSLLKSFSLRASLKDDGDMKKSIPSMETSSTQAEDKSSVRERKVPGTDSKEDCKGIGTSDNVVPDTIKDHEKSDDNNKAERKKKAARLIRSYIKSGKGQSRRGTIDGEGSEAGTASTTKRSSRDMSQDKANVEKIKDKRAADHTESQSKEPNTTVGTTSKTEERKTDNVEAIQTVDNETKEAEKEQSTPEETANSMGGTILGLLFGDPHVNEDKEDVQVNEVEKTENILLVETTNDTPEDEVVKEETTLEEKKSTHADPNLDEKKSKSTKSRSIFGMILRKPSNAENKEAPTDNAGKSDAVPVESITIPLKKSDDAPVEKNQTEDIRKEKPSEINTGIADVTKKNAEPTKNDAAAVVTEQSLFDVGLGTNDIEEFLRENYCGPVADCLGLTQFVGDKESIGATNVAVKPRKLKLDGGDVDIDQAVAAMRKSKRMAKMPIKMVGVPQDFIFPSTSSITDSQAAYKEGIQKSRKHKSKTAKDEADQRKVKNFLHKMGARPVNR